MDRNIKKYYEGADPSHLTFRNSLFVLRPICDSDLEIMFNWRVNPKVNQHLTSTPPKNMDDQRQWYKGYLQDPGSLYFMVLKRDNEDIKIGYCQLFKIDENAGNAEFGVVIGNEEYMQSGIGIKLAVTLIKLAFSYLGIRTIYGNIHLGNKISFKFHTRFIGSKMIEGPHVYAKSDEILFEISESIFESFEKRIFAKNEKWKDILEVEQIEMSV